MRQRALQDYKLNKKKFIDRSRINRKNKYHLQPKEIMNYMSQKRRERRKRLRAIIEEGKGILK